jgi:hypothetical protein
VRLCGLWLPTSVVQDRNDVNLWRDASLALLGARQAFARQNYFDERGVFAVVMFSGPVILLAMVQLVSVVALSLIQSWVRIACHVLP